GVAIEEASDRTRHAIPRATVVAGTVRKETHGEHAPKTAGAVHRDGPDRIVNLESVLDKGNAEADQYTCDEPDDGAACRVDETAGRGDGHQAGKQAIAAHRGIRLALQAPHIEEGAEGSGATGEHGVYRDGADAQASCC